MKKRKSMDDKDRKENGETVFQYNSRQGDLRACSLLKIQRNLCNDEKQCEIIPPFKLYYPTYSMAGLAMRISSCMIPKNMSTVLSAIFCALYTDTLGNTNRTVTKMGRKICNQRNELHNYKQIKKYAHGRPWVNFAMVREPAERFLSGFMYMCSP
ncbi:hypothetical protein TELCIR_13727 [Teladorsagia circumcincta]|uniref:Uncharacterized protein n=1 Tax=Teladorsagia circumcincta TaxID=45464 RepID=A0A2G9U2Y5_TELCI|nr:hypothetical protein TELCIR_13727 [Teladorsagia circumcincta]